MAVHQIRFLTKIFGQPVTLTGVVEFTAVDGRVIVKGDLAGNKRDAQLIPEDAKSLGLDLLQIVDDALDQVDAIVKSG